MKNTNDLREMLLSEIKLVQEGHGDHRRARSVAMLAGKILQSAKLDLDVLKFKLRGTSQEEQLKALEQLDK